MRSWIVLLLFPQHLLMDLLYSWIQVAQSFTLDSFLLRELLYCGWFSLSFRLCLSSNSCMSLVFHSFVRTCFFWIIQFLHTYRISFGYFSWEYCNNIGIFPLHAFGRSAMLLLIYLYNSTMNLTGILECVSTEVYLKFFSIHHALFRAHLHYGLFTFANYFPLSLWKSIKLCGIQTFESFSTPPWLGIRLFCIFFFLFWVYSVGIEKTWENIPWTGHVLL